MSAILFYLAQKDLDEARCEWNTHRIRPSPGARCPSGVPDELFYLPQPPAVNCLLTDVSDLPQEVFAELVSKLVSKLCKYELRKQLYVNRVV